MKKFIVSKIRKFLRAVLLPVIEEVFKKEAKNIRRMRQLIALEETARFIEKNVPKHPFISDRLELIKIASKRVTDDLKKGLICEFGVFKGESINYISKLFPDHNIFGFDAFFNGLPETFIEWSSPKGAFKLENLPVVSQNVELIPGYFHDSLPGFIEKHKEPFIFVHIDCDLYSSTKVIFNITDSKFQPGTVIVFDDYFNYPGWQDQEIKAFMEFITKSGLGFEYIAYSIASVAVQLKQINN